MRLSKPFLEFLYPGMRLKRWIFLLLFSAIVMVTGVGGLLGKTFSEYRFHIKPLRKVERQVRTYIRELRSMDLWLVALGTVGMLFALRRGYYAILTVFIPGRERQFGRMAYVRARRRRGPRIVAFGGGTGLSSLLTGLKEYTDNLSAVVTVADDGGSSGRLRRQFRMPPPGDIRSCLVALADAEPLMGRLFQHRFSRKGDLHGHSFGNLFLAALAEVTGDFSSAIAESSRVLAVRGRVIPVSLDLVMLAARLKDKRIVRGESRIATAGSPIDKVMLIPSRASANPDAVKALKAADILIFGPGSLYTSVIPNLLLQEIRAAIAASRALKIYVCNIMTQSGETDGYSAGDHFESVCKYLGNGGLKTMIANIERPSPKSLERYRRENSYLVALDEDYLRRRGVRVIKARLLASNAAYVRHDSVKLSRAIMKFAVI